MTTPMPSDQNATQTATATPTETSTVAAQATPVAVHEEYADTAVTSTEPIIEDTAAPISSTTVTDDADDRTSKVTRLIPAGVTASIAAAIPASVRERLPEVHMTTVDLPFDLPSVEVPTIDMSTLPKVSLPKMELPKVELPKVTMPHFDRPHLELPTADSIRASAKVVTDKASAFGRGVTQAVGIAREVVGLGERTPV